MRDTSRDALKEWAAIEQALATGETILLLRKGGIWEQKGEFGVEHREFWIFPTRFHQDPDELVAGSEWLMEAANSAHPGADRIRIAYYAEVADAYRIENADVFERLDGLHPLSEATVQSRFAYRDRPYLHALVLRTHRLAEPYIIPNTLGYEGCVSWVELDDELRTSRIAPVLDDAAFEARRAEIAERLDVPGVTRV